LASARNRATLYELPDAAKQCSLNSTIMVLLGWVQSAGQ
jgi:hypothetical protein